MTDKRPRSRATVPLVVGFTAIALLMGTLGAWSVGTRIAGAIVAPGTVRVQSERQVVQHPDGGVVGEILARDGDTVAAGDVLLRLDGTFLRSELAIVERQLAEIFARRARLIAERDGAALPDFADPPDFTLVPPEALREQTEGQTRLFLSRRAALEREQQQLKEQQRQIDRQIDGAEAQLAAMTRQVDLVSKELEDVERLFEQRLVQANRVLVLQREQARLEGEVGRLTSLVAQSQTRISELEIAALRLAEGRREDAITQLRDLGFTEIELQERRISLSERLARLDIRAPVAGTVFGSRVFAVQSVVQAAEPILYLVPSDQPLEVAARIDPTDVDQVFAGQTATLMFTAFNMRNTPDIEGTVLRVSADAETDSTTGIPFYEAIVVPDGAALAALGDMTLRPGMPVETFLRTEDRTPLSYLTQPMTVYFNRAFREE